MNQQTTPAPLSPADRLEIINLIEEFNVHEDTGAAVEWAALFTEAGSMQGLNKAPVTGTANLEALMRKRWAEKPQTHNRAHLATNFLISRTETGAKAASYQMSVDKLDEGFKIVAVSLKEDELTIENGRWRFAARRVVPLGAL